MTTTSNRGIVDLDALPGMFLDRVAKAQEIIAMGCSSHTVYARCGPGGPWQRLLPGVLLLSNGVPTRTELMRAALRFTEPGSLLTGYDALRLHGLRSADSNGPVHVLTTSRRQIRSGSLVRVERTTRLPRPVIRARFPIAPTTRAVLDTARTLSSLDQARAVMAETVQRRMTNADLLITELAAGSQRGSALPRKVLSEIEAGVHSAAESWGYRIVTKSALPAPEWNVRIHDTGGSLLGIVDAWWDSVAMAWEIDSFEFHLSPDDYKKTLERHARMTGAGIVVVHTVPSRIRREPKSVLNELTAAYHQAATRPRPLVNSG